MKRGDIFIGAFSSHFSKLAFYAMAGHNFRIPAFVSLDYPLSCDTIDSCGDDDISHRNQSVEDIIFRAPDCQDRINMQSKDPCGLALS